MGLSTERHKTAPAGSGRRGIRNRGREAATERATAVDGGVGPVPVLVLTANAVFASRLRRGLGAAPELTVTFGELPTKKIGVAELAARHKARIVAADAALFEQGLLLPAIASHEREPLLDVLLLFPRIGDAAVDLSLTNHAHGCLDFATSPEMFARAADAMANHGELWFPRWMMEPFYAMARAAAALHAAPEGASAEHELTDREAEVLHLAQRGLTNKEIAGQLDISPHTVKKHLHNALIKHGIRRRRQLFR